MSGHSDRARRALAHLAEADPALAALALWCAHRDGTGEMRSEGSTIYYDAGFPLRPLPEQVGLAGHHVLHAALGHGARKAAMGERQGAGFDPARFALAADAIVNEALLLAGHALPRPAVRLTELLAVAGLGQAAPDTALADWDVERLYARLPARAGAGGEEVAAYAAAKGFSEDFEAEAAESPGRESAPEDWRGALARAMEAGRRAGRGIGRLAGRVADIPETRTPWELELRGLLARAAAEAPEPAAFRPARRWIATAAEARARGAELPGFQPGTARTGLRPRIAVGLDSSGSVADGTLARFAAELDAIARRSRAETHLLAFDETVHSARELGPGGWDAALRARPLRRGGGTAFGDVLARAAELDASVAVIMTDLDGAFGPPPKGLPVIWAVPGPPPAPPPFGRVLRLDR